MLGESLAGENLLHRVVAAFVPGITAQDPPNGHQAALNHPVLFNRLTTVFGTGGMKSAVAIREKTGEDTMVK